MNGKFLACFGALLINSTMMQFNPLMAADGEGIVLDPNTGDYHVTYREPNPPYTLTTITFIPATKIDPVVKSTYSLDEKGLIRYAYRVTNSRASKQLLVKMLASATRIESAIPNAPAKWSGLVVPSTETGQVTFGWAYDSNDQPFGLPAGETRGGFSVTSFDLPGIGLAKFSAYTRNGPYADEGPDPGSEVGKKLNDLVLNDFVTRLAVVPHIGVSSPYEAAPVLANIQKHLDTGLVNLKLVDSGLVTELDRWLVAAVAAANSGNDKALRADIHEARQLLKREHEDVDKDDNGDHDDARTTETKSRINKLAARVLDFDLHYVEKRIKGKGSDDR